MFQLVHAGRANLFVFQCTQRKSSYSALQLLALNSTRVNQQKTKVEMMAMPFLRSFASPPVSRPYSAMRRLEKISSLFRGGSFSDFSPRMLNFSHLRGRGSTMRDRSSLCLWNGRSFAPKLSARQKSDVPSKKTQTDRFESAFWQEWDRRKTGAYYILAAFMLAGGAVYLYQHRSKRSELASLAEPEVDVAEKESTKNSGRKSSKSAAKSLAFEKAITQAADLCQRLKDESGSPGLVVGVSIDGQPVWEHGFGYADVENRLPYKPETVFRIASISKSITMVALAKLMESGDLDIDKPVQVYAPQFPEKTVDGEKVTVTTRQLVSHLSGVRHYSKKYVDKDPSLKSEDPNKSEGKSKGAVSSKEEYQLMEYFIKDKYESTEAALTLFKDDPLVQKPGTKFLYSTHAWTLLAAVLEGVTKKKYPQLIRQLFQDLGLKNTYLDENEPLIYNRASNYVRNDRGRLMNAPYVDCSYKYAGGGMLSTVNDLLRFANIMLYSFQFQEPSANEKDNTTVAVHKAGDKADGPNETSFITNPEKPVPGYLKSSTVQQLWTPVKLTGDRKGAFYGMGWIMPGKPAPPIGFGRKNQTHIYHTGGAIGASSVLLILPSQSVGDKQADVPSPPRGVCVAMAGNMISISPYKTALQVAQLFEQVSSD